MYRIIIFFVLLFSFISCNKEEENLDFSISLVDTFPLIISEFQENVVVKIKYQHSEGYIGFSNPDVLSLEIKDSRLVNSDYFHLIPLNPPSQSLSVKGEIEIEIDSPFILGNENIQSESLFYSIRIQDNNSKWSNLIETPQITVNRL